MTSAVLQQRQDGPQDWSKLKALLQPLPLHQPLLRRRRIYQEYAHADVHPTRIVCHQIAGEIVHQEDNRLVVAVFNRSDIQTGIPDVLYVSVPCSHGDCQCITTADVKQLAEPGEFEIISRPLCAEHQSRPISSLLSWEARQMLRLLRRYPRPLEPEPVPTGPYR